MSHLEEDLKTALKSLFNERKKVKELQIRLIELEQHSVCLKTEIAQLHLQHIPVEQEESLKEKFLQKLKEIQYGQLKEKEEEITNLKKQLLVLKPTLRRLIEELKRVRGQNNHLQKNWQAAQKKLAIAEEAIKQWQQKCVQLQQIVHELEKPVVLTEEHKNKDSLP